MKNYKKFNILISVLGLIICQSAFSDQWTIFENFKKDWEKIFNILQKDSSAYGRLKKESNSPEMKDLIHAYSTLVELNTSDKITKSKATKVREAFLKLSNHISSTYEKGEKFLNLVLKNKTELCKKLSTPNRRPWPLVCEDCITKALDNTHFYEKNYPSEKSSSSESDSWSDSDREVMPNSTPLDNVKSAVVPNSGRNTVQINANTAPGNVKNLNSAENSLVVQSKDSNALPVEETESELKRKKLEEKTQLKWKKLQKNLAKGLPEIKDDSDESNDRSFHSNFSETDSDDGSDRNKSILPPKLLGNVKSAVVPKKKEDGVRIKLLKKQFNEVKDFFSKNLSTTKTLPKK
ncbi:hypothetical protein [Holospora undulata]|uniref:Uncharacterized protein n=1 Tax=Holospora undulata HU1 TaxID=1321371 RepID=A0A061JGT7_9PROT|nr:hypothetical protein [Holospora undulata]ETZ05295.1 hypothetical protein K737_300271 [Holospora undulata HU1]